LLFSKSFLVLRPGTKGILSAQEESLFPLLDVGKRDPVLSGGFLHDSLTHQDAEHQRCLPICRPPLDVFLLLFSH
jgi:hypothetical protein